MLNPFCRSTESIIGLLIIFTLFLPIHSHGVIQKSRLQYSFLYKNQAVKITFFDFFHADKCHQHY